LSINISSRTCQLLIGTQDWTNWIDGNSGIQVGYPEYDVESGLLAVSGTVTLSFRLDDPTLPSNPNYRANPSQWRRGQNVSIKVVNSIGVLTPLPCSGNLLYLLKPTQAPQLSTDGISVIALNIGCRLGLEYFPPEPNKDVSGVIAGNPLNRSQIITNILNFLGVPCFITSMPYQIDYALPKTSGNWLSMCGELAYSAGYYLRCDLNGIVNAYAINLGFFGSLETYTVGIDEQVWQPIGDSSEQPVEKLIVAGVRQIVEEVDTSPEIFIEYAAVGKILPKLQISDVTSLTISKSTKKTVEPPSKKDTYVLKEVVKEPVGVVLPKVRTSQPQSLTISLDKEITYTLDKGNVISQLTIEQQPIGAVLPNVRTGFAQGLIITRKELITWEIVGDQVWEKTYKLEQPISVIFPKTTQGNLTGLITTESYTNSKDTIGPPTNIGDISKNKITEETIKTEIFAAQLATSGGRRRQRTINLPFAIEVPQLIRFGYLFNAFLTGRSLGWQFGGVITDISLSFAPFVQVSVIDRTIVYYLKIDAIQYAINLTSAYIIWNGIEVGVANIAAPEEISRPVTITLGVFELVIETSAIAVLPVILLFNPIAFSTSFNRNLITIEFEAIVISSSSFATFDNTLFGAISIATQSASTLP
jgi:hypothetical protein